MEILAVDMSGILQNVLHILYVALGLGLVIFFHELGHFAVAKWCGVLVERFSLGFGPILWSFKRGDTEYALSLVPFGGYVKMLGQDDMDPSQLSNEEIAEDPNSYTAKTVGQRMGIISAGVIMNIITGVLFFALAFHFGVETSPPKVGQVVNGNPAWVHGLLPGDTITRINGREVRSFMDILRGTTLSRGDIRLEGIHEDGTTFDITLEPNRGLRRMIGISDARSKKIMALGKDNPVSAIPGTPAAKALGGFKKDDVLLAVRTVPAKTDKPAADEKGEADAKDQAEPDEETVAATEPEVYELKIESVPEFKSFMAEHRDKSVDIDVQRGGSTETIRVEPRRFKEIGIWFDIERISAIQQSSPAAEAGLQVGDRITNVNDKDVGTEINPLHLAELFEAEAGRPVKVTVKRDVKGAPEPETKTVTLTPNDVPSWISGAISSNTPLAIPSIGVAYHLNSNVVKVLPGSAAEKAKIKEGMTLKTVTLTTGNKEFEELTSAKPLEIKFDEEDKQNVAFALWQMQEIPDAKVKIAVEGISKSFNLKLADSSDDYFVPSRGILLAPESRTLIATNISEAFGMATHRTWTTAIDIYLTLRNLVVGELSAKNLRGPIGIFQVGYQVSQQGIPKLLLFLGFLSVNLAVLNFLPIPVLDGGHMVFLIWEAVTRKKPSERVLQWAQIAGLAFVVGLMLFVICLDVFYHKLSV